jgi:hypothetical protein
MINPILTSLILLASISDLQSNESVQKKRPRKIEKDCVLFMDCHGQIGFELDGCEFIIHNYDHSVDCYQCNAELTTDLLDLQKN